MSSKGDWGVESMVSKVRGLDTGFYGGLITKLLFLDCSRLGGIGYWMHGTLGMTTWTTSRFSGHSWGRRLGQDSLGRLSRC